MEIVYYTIDRFEEDVAVCENQSTGKMENIARSLIEPSAREGDVIFWKEGSYVRSLSETQKAREDIFALLKQNQAIE